jgi:hypothetical protein
MKSQRSQRYECSVSQSALIISGSIQEESHTAISVVGKETRPKTEMVSIALPSLNVQRAMSFEFRAVERLILLSPCEI